MIIIIIKIIIKCSKHDYSDKDADDIVDIDDDEILVKSLAG